MFRMTKFPELLRLKWWQGPGGGAGVGREDANPQLLLAAAPESFPACLPPCCPQPDFSCVLGHPLPNEPGGIPAALHPTNLPKQLGN